MPPDPDLPEADPDDLLDGCGLDLEPGEETDDADLPAVSDGQLLFFTDDTDGLSPAVVEVFRAGPSVPDTVEQLKALADNK